MFWENLIELCNKNGKKPNPVAKELGISSGAVTSWKNGTIPSTTTLKKLADYFGVTVEYFFVDHTDNTLNLQIFASGADNSVLKTMQGHGVIDRPQGVKIPVFGAVAAGIPISAITDIEDYEEIPSDMAALGEYCALRIKGNSMEPMMLPGDTVIIKVQQDVNDGEIAVVLINGNDATCKKIKKTPEGVLLISLNPTYEPMFFSNADVLELPVTVFGKVVELRRKLH